MVITSHKAPDGDAVGSALGLSHVMRNAGYDVSVVLPDGFAHFLDWMEGTEGIVFHDSDNEKAEALMAEAGLLFALDYNQPSRIGGLGVSFTQATGKKIMIDHHRDPETFCDHVISDISASSTAELVYLFIEEHIGTTHMNAAAADCMYTGIMTDSGSFRYSTTSARTHEITAKLIGHGARNSEIHELIYDQDTISKTRLWSHAMSGLEMLEDGRIGLLAVSEQELIDHDYREGDLEGLVNQPLAIKGVVMSILARQHADIIKLSFRSKGTVPVNDLAKDNFGGGGHLNAAGGMSRASLVDTVSRIKEVAGKYLKD